MSKLETSREFSSADEYPIVAGSEGAFATETYNLWLYDPAERIGLNIWLASTDRTFPRFMSTVLVFDEASPEGGRWSGRYDGSGNHPQGVGGGGVFLTIGEPFRRLQVDVLGLLTGADQPGSGDAIAGDSSAPPILGRMALDVDILSPPIEQGSQGDRGDIAASGLIPRTAIRYEQLVHVTGSVSFGRRAFTLDAYGMRSHRRNSASIYASGAVGHTWATASFPSRRGFHLLSYLNQPDAAVGFLAGHYFDGERYHDAEVTGFPFYSGDAGAERYELSMRAGGTTLRILCESLPPVTSDIPPTDVLLTRSAARFTLNGEVGGGVLERSLSRRLPPGGAYHAGN